MSNTEYHEPRYPAFEPQFWNGTPPIPYETITIDCSQYKMFEDGKAILNPTVVEIMKKKFDEHGAFYLTNTGYTKSEEMVKYMKVFIDGKGNY